MSEAANACAIDCAWKLRTLIRTSRYHTDSELVLLYKSHILSFIESRTAALSHASVSMLSPIDTVQD
eukprot:6705890-Alexandrium_andersonii.AAC.1